MPGSPSVIGKVSLTVWPDTRKFLATLAVAVEKAAREVERLALVHFKAQLEVDEAQAKAAGKEIERLVGEIKARVEVEADEFSLTKLQAELKALSEDLIIRLREDPSDMAEIRARIKALRDTAVVLDVEIDNKWQEDLLRVMRGVEIEVDPVLRDEKALLLREKAEAYFGHIEAKIQVELDGGHARMEMKRLADQLETEAKIKAELDEWSKRSALTKLKFAFREIKALVKASVVGTAVKKARAQLAATVAAWKNVQAKIKVALDSKSVARAKTALMALSGGRFAQKIFNVKMFSHLDEQLPKITAMAAGIGQIGAMAVSSAGKLLGMGRELSQIAAIGLAVPGVLVGIGASIAVLAVALSDIKDRVPELEGAWDKMKKSIQNNFWKQAATPIKQLAHEWLPLAHAGMSKMATAGGRLFADMAKDLRSVVTSKLPGWFKAAADSLDDLRESTPAIANIVGMLGDLGAEYLPRLAQWQVRITNKFSDWLNNKGVKGLTKMVDTAIQRIEELWNVVKGAVKVLGRLGDAALKAGGSPLKQLGDNLNKIADLLDKPAIQKTLVSVFTAANAAMKEMADHAAPGVKSFFSSLGTLLPRVLPVLGEIVGKFINLLTGALAQPSVGQSITNFFDAVNNVMTDLQPVMPIIAEGFAGIVNLLADLANGFGPIAIRVIEHFGSVGSGAFGAIGDVVGTLSGALDRLIDEILPGLTPMLQPAADLFKSMGNAIAKITDKVGPPLGEFLKTTGEALDELEPYLSTVIDAIGEGLGTAIGGTLGELSKLWKSFEEAEWPVRIIAFLLTVVANNLRLAGLTIKFVVQVLSLAIQKLVNQVTTAVTVIQRVFALDFAGAANAMAEGVKKDFDLTTGYMAEWGNDITGQLQYMWDNAALITGTGMEDLNAEVVAGTGGMSGTFATGMEGVENIARIKWQHVVDETNSKLSEVLEGIKTNGDKMTEEQAKSLTAMGEQMAREFEAMGDTASAEEIRRVTETKKNGKDWVLAYDGNFDGLTNSLVAGYAGINSGAKAGQTDLENLQDKSNSFIGKEYDDLWVSRLPKTVDEGWEGILKEYKEGAKDSTAVVDKLTTDTVKQFDGLKEKAYPSGQAVMNAFAKGMENRVQNAVQTAKNAMEAIRKVFPSSPAKIGAFSGKGWTLYSGRATMKGYMEGVGDEISHAQNMVERAMDAIHTPFDAASTALRHVPSMATQAEGPITIGNLTIGPDDPDYDAVKAIGDVVRRRKRQITGRSYGPAYAV